MKKFSMFLLSTIFILITHTNVHAQLVRIGIGGGLTNVAGPDALTNDVSAGGLGYSSEYNLGIEGKISLPLIPITPRAFVLYHNLGGEGNGIITAKGNDVTTSIEYSQSILSLGAGVQYGFIPIPVGIDPYLSFDVTFNNFGDLTTTTNGNETTVEGNSRMGIQLGVGAEVSIIPAINLDVFAGYNIFNFTGKEDGEDTISSINLDVFLVFSFI